MIARPDWSPVATNLVNLDALLVREDFESLEPGVLANQSPQRDVSLRLPDLAPTGISREALRKPDFQRETAYWTARAIAEFVHSFVSGDFVPSIIGWRNPITGNIFVIDGAHRLSALIAWVEDDYGDGVRSLAFFQTLFHRNNWKRRIRLVLLSSASLVHIRIRRLRLRIPIHLARI